MNVEIAEIIGFISNFIMTIIISILGCLFFRIATNEYKKTKQKERDLLQAKILQIYHNIGGSVIKKYDKNKGGSNYER